MDKFRFQAPFEIKEGEFFVVDIKEAKVLKESTLHNQHSTRAFSPMPTKADAVNHPSHYNTGKIEVIEFIEDQRLEYHLGNTVKYIARAGRKDPTKELEDLEKAAWYLNRKIEILKSKREGRVVRRPNDMAAPKSNA